MIPNPLRLLWAVWVWLLVLPMLAITALPILALPRLAQRRAVARGICRGYFLLCGLPIRVRGIERLPPGACIIVANHASYVDGPLLFACLPPRFGFVIKKEASRIPFAGGLLRRLGHHFVERRNRHEGGSDARRILRAVENGQAIAFFPEGTFVPEPGLGRFHSGAFAAAVRAGVPVAPVVIRGTRRVLGGGTFLPRWDRIDVEVLPPLAGTIAPATRRGAARRRAPRYSSRSRRIRSDACVFPAARRTGGERANVRSSERSSQPGRRAAKRDASPFHFRRLLVPDRVKRARDAPERSRLHGLLSSANTWPSRGRPPAARELAAPCAAACTSL